MLSRGLMISHFSIAAMTKTPELVLDQTEAEGLAEYSVRLMELYEIKPNPKVECAILLAGQIGMVYGSRIVAIRTRQRKEKAQSRSGTATVENTDGSTGTAPFTAADMPPQGTGNIGSIN